MSKKRMKVNKYKSIEEYKTLKGSTYSYEITRELYKQLFDEYLNSLSEEARVVAKNNDALHAKLSDDTYKILEVRIKDSLSRFRQQFSGTQDILGIGGYERWGQFSLHVDVLCKNKNELYKIRETIPNFYEGWYVELYGYTKNEYWIMKFKNEAPPIFLLIEILFFIVLIVYLCIVR